MNITAINFRDHVVTEITIGYDWENSDNYVLIKVIDTDKFITNYRISGLKEYYIYEDFQAMHIEQCKLEYTPNGVYLSLDPFDEKSKTTNKDNYYFIGQDIESM